MSRIVLIYFLASCFVMSFAADILIISSTPSKSVSLWFHKMALLLANNNHQVFLLDTDLLTVKHENISQRLMVTNFSWVQVMEEMVKENPEALDTIIGEFSPLETMITMTFSDADFVGCNPLLKSDDVKNFMKEFHNKKFDLIIADSLCEAFFGFVSFFENPPFIPMIPSFYIMSAPYMGQYDNPSFVPFPMSNYDDKMNFLERAANTFFTYYMNAIIRLKYHPRLDKVMKEVFGPSVASINDILLNRVSLMMSEYHYVLHGAKAFSPAIINIPGFHIDPLKPLPQDIKKFLDEAKDGAILFSMGSNFKSILMSPEKREMFLSVFRNIPQRIIWKLELDNETDIPPNVMIKKWLPQSDILGHPNVKAFIYHGGLLGIEEAVYHGVPVLGLPLMFDQVSNLEGLRRAGVAIRLHYKDLNPKSIAQQINKIINDPRYMNNMKQYSAAFRDVPQNPREKALFWIEYALRNAKNTKNYLKPLSANMPWYQTMLIDVAAFFITCLFVIYWIIKSIFKILCMLCCRRKANEKKISSYKKNK